MIHALKAALIAGTIAVWGLLAFEAIAQTPTETPCYSQEDHIKAVTEKYDGVTWRVLGAEDTAAFSKNFMAMEPVTTVPVTRVIVYTHPKYSALFVSVELNGCFSAGGNISQVQLDLSLIK